MAAALKARSARRPARRRRVRGEALNRARAKNEMRLKEAGFVIPLSEWLGHNNGPEMSAATAYQSYLWRKAHAEAWKAPSPEIVALRARRAEALGISYEELTLEILERGRYGPDKG